MNPYKVVEDFEKEIGVYTGAPQVTCVNSCTAAILLACEWLYKTPMVVDNKINHDRETSVPRLTYCSVPMSIIRAGGKVIFRDEKWVGDYQLYPYPIWDSARWFTSNMYRRMSFQCVSFHASKTLGIEAGGAILHDNPAADLWFKKARHDGRTPGVAPKDDELIVGHHCLMNPSIAAQGLLKLHSLPKNNPPLLGDDYGDLSLQEVFQ